jgi:geranylgeranyl diphosphate synthase type II
MFDLNAYLNAHNKRINRALETILKTSAKPDRILEAMTYSLMAGGKRIRPVLCLAAAEAVGADSQSVVSAACALEMIHTYSLIHDDLPAMDDDAMRRGQPTCHVAFDEATAILAGDAADQAAKWLKVIRLIAHAAGYRGMIQGQMLDIASEGEQLTVDELESIHALKTGALIQACLGCGAILGGANSEQIEMLETYAQHIGLAFQITDDILNIEGDPEILGKAVGTDQLRDKNTYPSLLGLQKSKEFARESVKHALQALESFDHRAEPLRAIASYIIERKK